MTWAPDDLDRVRRAARGLDPWPFAVQVARHLSPAHDYRGWSKGAILEALAAALPQDTVDEALRLIAYAQEWRRHDAERKRAVLDLAERSRRKRDDPAPGVRDEVDSLARRVGALEAQVAALLGRPK